MGLFGSIINDMKKKKASVEESDSNSPDSEITDKDIEELRKIIKAKVRKGKRNIVEVD